MPHKTVLTPIEITPGIFISQISTLPSMLKKCDDGTFNYATNGIVSVGDEIEVWPFAKVVVKQVVESRKARGNWAQPSYEGANPMFHKIKIM